MKEITIRSRLGGGKQGLRGRRRREQSRSLKSMMLSTCRRGFFVVVAAKPGGSVPAFVLIKKKPGKQACVRRHGKVYVCMNFKHRFQVSYVDLLSQTL